MFKMLPKALNESTKIIKLSQKGQNFAKFGHTGLGYNKGRIF